LVNLHIFDFYQSSQELLSEVRRLISFFLLLLQYLAYFLGREEHHFLFQVRFAVFLFGFFPHSFHIDEAPERVVSWQLRRLVFQDVADGYGLVRERVSEHERLKLLYHQSVGRDNVTSCLGWNSHKVAVVLLDLVQYHFLSEGSFVHNAFISIGDESWV